MSYNILIVDDEHLSREYIKDIIHECDPSVNIFEAQSAEEALPILENENVDVLFSDVRMPKVSGFGLLKSVSHRNFELVFVTAYKEYAIQAIKEGATDYILKPIKKPEFKETFQKVIRKRAEEKSRMLHASEEADYLDNKLALGHQQGIKYIMLKDISYLEANNTYTTLVLSSGEKIVASKPINKFESILSPNWFFRIHKSHIVNIFHFKEYISKDGDIALMDNDTKLNISRYKVTEFLDAVARRSGRLKV